MADPISKMEWYQVWFDESGEVHKVAVLAQVTNNNVTKTGVVADTGLVLDGDGNDTTPAALMSTAVTDLS